MATRATTHPKTRNAPQGPSPFRIEGEALPTEKFSDPQWTAKGKRRASVPLTSLETLWFNTGTLCNLACATCYIESSPTNDALVYIDAQDVAGFLNETEGMGTREIGFTGGEPFMNPQFLAMLEDTLKRGFEALVLTNAMKPMRRHEAALLALKERFSDRLTLRVSLDHHTQEGHEGERGPRSWEPGLDGLKWLSDNGFSIAVAGRLLPGEDMEDAREGYARLFAAQDIRIDAAQPDAAGAVSGDGRQQGRGRDHRRLLEHPRSVPGRYHVRHQPHGRPPQGRRGPPRCRLYADPLRQGLRYGGNAGRGER